MKKDDKHGKDKPDRKIIRHPTAPFSMKSIIMNLIIAFFLYLLRRVIGLYSWNISLWGPLMVLFPTFQKLAGKVRSPSTAGLSNEVLREWVIVAGVGLNHIFFFANVFPATIDKYNVYVIRLRKRNCFFFLFIHIRNWKLLFLFEFFSELSYYAFRILSGLCL